MASPSARAIATMPAAAIDGSDTITVGAVSKATWIVFLIPALLDASTGSEVRTPSRAAVV
jgi:hypothetical protein